LKQNFSLLTRLRPKPLDLILVLRWLGKSLAVFFALHICETCLGIIPSRMNFTRFITKDGCTIHCVKVRSLCRL